MATVKIMFRKSVVDLFNYVDRGRESDDPIDFIDCSHGTLATSFRATQSQSRPSPNEAIHIIQSWGPAESKKVNPWKFNEMGKELSERLFPGHAAAIVTHTETGKTHNHIVLNPVNSLGQRINNEKKHLYALREVNDQLAKENGLSVVKEHSRERWDKMSTKVRAINKRAGFSRISDLKEKAQFSMGIATSFDEYSSYLNRAFDIKVKIRGTSVSYIYPGMNRAKRGSKLGSQYTFESLTKKFAENDQKLVAKGLKKESDIFGKDYRDFYRFKKDEKDFLIPGHRLTQSLVSVDVIESLRKQSIEDYCQKQNISLFKDENSQTKLKMRDYIHIDGSYWHNQKNQTKGGLIEFIANYERVDFLRAINSEVKSDRLKKVAEALEIKEPSFKAFYVPNQKPLFREKEKAYSLARANKFNHELLYQLSAMGRFKAYDDLRFKIFSLGEKKRSLTFYLEESGKWSSRSQGHGSDNFFEMRGQKNELVIFDTPLSFLKTSGLQKILQKEESPFHFLVPMEPVEKWIKDKDDFISSFEKVKFVRDPSRNSLDEVLSFSPRKERGLFESLSIRELDLYVRRSLTERGRSR